MFNILNIFIRNETDVLETHNEPVLELLVQQLTKFPLNMENISLNKCSYCHKEARFNEENNAKLPRCTKCYRSAYCNAECQKNDWLVHSSDVCSLPNDCIGFPFIVRFKKSDLVNKEHSAEHLIRSLLIKSCLATVECPNLDESKKNNFEIDLFVTSGENKFSLIKIDNKFETLINLFMNKVKETGSKLISFKLQLKWNNQNTSSMMQTNLSRVLTLKNNQNVNTHVDLNECLRLFTQPEKLTSDNPWYCSRCKKHQEAMKQISLWKLPKYLIISLKRFQATKADSLPFMNMSEETKNIMMINSRFSYMLQNRVVYNKLNTMIKFPIRYHLFLRTF